MPVLAEVFGLERPGGGPLFGSMLGAEALRAARKGVCAEEGGDRGSMKGGGEGTERLQEMMVV